MPAPVLPDPLPDGRSTAPPGYEESSETPLPLQSGSPVNWFLIAGSVAMYAWSAQGENLERLAAWFISLQYARIAS